MIDAKLMVMSPRPSDLSGRFSRLFGRAFVLAALLLAVTGCGGSGTEEATPLQLQSNITVNAMTDFGARADGVTDDEPAIQAAINLVSRRGGGVVYLPEGVYGIARPLVLRSNIKLHGDGRGRTIVRSLVPSLGKTVDGTGIWSAIAVLSADGVTVSDLTVDLATAATHSNGIALLPSGANFDGKPSTNCVVTHVEVLGGGNYHAYMIWNMRGQSIEITNNVVDGGIVDPVGPLDSNQEGIESFGGKDVLVAWNTVRNIGNTALNFGSAGLPNTGIDGLIVTGNVVSNSGRGLNLGPWLDPSGPQNVANVQIIDNEFSDLWNSGMYFPVQGGTRIDGLHIVGNSIQSVGSDESIGAVGIRFEGKPAAGSTPASESSDTYVMENQIKDVRGTNSFGLLINYYSGVLVSGNVIDGTGNGGIQAFGSSGLAVEDNLITSTDRIAVGSYGPNSSIYLRGNQMVDWGLAVPTTSVLIDHAQEGEVRENEFQKAERTGPVVIVGAGAANVIVFGNAVSSDEDFSERAKPNPFVSLAENSNLGTFFAAAEFTTMRIEQPLSTPTSRVILEQLAGEPLVASATPMNGEIEVTFESMPVGDENFRYEIDP